MLQITNLSKSFAASDSPSLSNINLRLNQNEFCIVIGSNGSGKSTLLRCISGEYAYEAGHINIKPSLIASVTQDVNKGTIAEMTCLENMVLSLIRMRAAHLSFYQQFKDELIEGLKELDIGLEAYIDRPLGSLSGGQRQMIATVMALSSKPEILLLDEHTSALDPKMQKLLMDYTVSGALKQKISTMMVTHKLEDAVNYGNRLIMLSKGKIILDLNKEEKSLLTANSLLQLFHQVEAPHV